MQEKSSVTSIAAFLALCVTGMITGFLVGALLVFTFDFWINSTVVSRYIAMLLVVVCILCAFILGKLRDIHSDVIDTYNLVEEGQGEIEVVEKTE